jgi:hypothetical protein
MFQVSQSSKGIILPVMGTHLNSPISQKLINLGGTPEVMQNRWSCTCNRAGPVAIFALGGADVICIRNCWSVGEKSSMISSLGIWSHNRSYHDILHTVVGIHRAALSQNFHALFHRGQNYFRVTHTVPISEIQNRYNFPNIFLNRSIHLKYIK